MLQSVSSVDDLVSLVASGVRVKYLFFWGHRPSADGRVTASCLSQWWPAPFTVDGERFASAEQGQIVRANLQRARLKAPVRSAAVCLHQPQRVQMFGIRSTP